MSIVLHPTAYSKFAGSNYVYKGKLIPREEYNTFVSAIHQNTKILCVDWPNSERLAPVKHKILKAAIADVCASKSLLPMTFRPSGSIEPQMIAEDKLYLEDDTYLIECDHAAPVLVNGRAIVYVTADICVAVNTLAEQATFVANNHTGTKLDTAVYRVSRHKNGALPFVRFGVWDQPYRVKHINAYMMLANGLILG